VPSVEPVAVILPTHAPPGAGNLDTEPAPSLPPWLHPMNLPRTGQRDCRNSQALADEFPLASGTCLASGSWSTSSHMRSLHRTRGDIDATGLAGTCRL
jgi:hypothetical protein